MGLMGCAIGVLKGQHDIKPRAKRSDALGMGNIINPSLFLFRAGAAAGAKQEKGKWDWLAPFPRAPIAATSALGYFGVAPLGRHGSVTAGASSGPGRSEAY